MRRGGADLQLHIDLGDQVAVRIERMLVDEIDHFRRMPVDDGDAANEEARVSLIRGNELLLEWIARTASLPEDAEEWPCSACRAAPGQPCDIPGPRTKWTPPGPRYHLDRGLHGRWAA